MEEPLNICMNKISRLKIIFPVALLILLCGMTVHAEGPKTVAIIPFEVNAEKDLSFLKKGIADMLSSRLFSEGEVSVVSREKISQALEGVQMPLNDPRAKALGQKLGADYVLFGSLTVFGESVSIDAKMLDVTGAGPPMAFFTQTESLGAVIPQIDLFASDINRKVFGRAPAAMAAAPAPSPGASPAAGPQTPPPADIHAHPEKLLQGGFSTDDETVAEKEFIAGSGGRRFWKSRNFDYLINGIALGDVDGDGKVETVIVTPDTVLIYRKEAGRFFEVSRLEPFGSKNIVGVDIADINKNGTPEIFVSCLNSQRTNASSMVLEFNGSQYKPIAEDQRWYYRVVTLPERGAVLYGQRQKTGGDPFSSPIYELAWEGGGYVSQNRVLPKGKANLLGFSAGDPRNSGSESAIVYDRSDRLQVLEVPSGKEAWTSSEVFGGSTLYLLLPVEDKGGIERRGYLPMRVEVLDLDGDGKTEVLVAQNSDVAGRHLAQFRNFTKSQFLIFSWDGLGLRPVWKTRTLSGHIRDFAVGDFDNDGAKEIVLEIIQKEGSVVGVSPRCAVIAFDLKN